MCELLPVADEAGAFPALACGDRSPEDLPARCQGRGREPGPVTPAVGPANGHRVAWGQKPPAATGQTDGSGSPGARQAPATMLGAPGVVVSEGKNNLVYKYFTEVALTLYCSLGS